MLWATGASCECRGLGEPAMIAVVYGSRLRLPWFTGASYGCRGLREPATGAMNYDLWEQAVIVKLWSHGITLLYY